MELNTTQEKTKTFTSCKRHTILQNQDLKDNDKQNQLTNLNKIRNRNLLNNTINERTELLRTKPRNRTLHIASVNVDTLRTNDSIYNSIENITSSKIDIARIQEKDYGRNDSIIINN